MTNKPRTLSKSRFTLAMECPTKLYYTGKHKEYADTKGDNDFLMALAEGGFQVGELAKQYYPLGKDVKELDYHKALAKTNEHLQNENITIFEAAIAFEKFFIRVDILEKVGNKINLIEVKAKSFHPEETEFTYKKSDYIRKSWRPYLNDVAFQTWVAQNAFPDWQISPFLMLTDKSKTATVNNLNQYFRIRKNAEDPKRRECYVKDKIGKTQLGDPILTTVPVDGFVRQIWNGRDIEPKKKTAEELRPFEERIQDYADHYEKDQKFAVSIGTQCKDCEFKNSSPSSLKNGFEECWTEALGESFDVNEPHIFDIWYAPKKKEMLKDGTYYIKDVDVEKYLMKTKKSGYLEYSGTRAPRQALQIEKVQNNDWTEDVKPELFDEMAGWNYPLHFIDFETSMVAIPFYKGRRPYEQTAFQFSCHTLYEDGNVEHTEWINTEQGVFPNFEFVSALKKVLEKDNGTIFRFAAHENIVLRQIKSQMEIDDANHYKDLIDFINLITEKKDENHKGDRSMIDLNKMVQKYYYHPDMEGSNGLKKVLPAVMNASPFLNEKYSKPLTYGKWLKGRTLWELDETKGRAKDPYSLLPPIFDDVDSSRDVYQTEKGEIKDGGAAMTAYCYLQFADIPASDRQHITDGLLRYCELDTLAMVMVWEHWNSLK